MNLPGVARPFLLAKSTVPGECLVPFSLKLIANRVAWRQTRNRILKCLIVLVPLRPTVRDVRIFLHHVLTVRDRGLASQVEFLLVQERVDVRVEAAERGLAV